MRQAPVASCLSSSSVVRFFTQKKKNAARHVQRVRILPLASPSSSSASSSSSPSSLSYNDEPKAGIDWPVPSIIREKEEEEEKMASDLRVGFYERQHKRLSESIAINPFPSKKSLPGTCPRSSVQVNIADHYYNRHFGAR